MRGLLVRYKSPVQQHGILNLTPLIDIVFLLLVFFMLTAHFVDEKQIALQLPSAESAMDTHVEDIVTVSIDAAGIYFIDGEALHAHMLRERLKVEQGKNPEIILQLKADQEVSYSKLVHVLDSARLVGISSIDIVTEPL